ncbi:hypothetical protein PAXRUDRAFT_793664 [Paxillus rubicundulus Ve08.2h10]|uniref:Uncharacterized protein n=1 Tax=Paxillus rubicundulus Ve08.2h10 TaxID=930991 RepID=A0A0D0CDJ5_9AGAM|nr:hypothetical protein PAXRUDRAFT_793664 [Paxillus rubicundulus Ve08.2h10]
MQVLTVTTLQGNSSWLETWQLYSFVVRRLLQLPFYRFRPSSRTSSTSVVSPKTHSNFQLSRHLSPARFSRWPQLQCTTTTEFRHQSSRNSSSYGQDHIASLCCSRERRHCTRLYKQMQTFHAKRPLSFAFGGKQSTHSIFASSLPPTCL